MAQKPEIEILKHKEEIRFEIKNTIMHFFEKKSIFNNIILYDILIKNVVNELILDQKLEKSGNSDAKLEAYAQIQDLISSKM